MRALGIAILLLGIVACNTMAQDATPRRSRLGNATPLLIVEDPPPAAWARVDFAQHIHPILKQHCYSCHGPNRADSDLRLGDASGILKTVQPGAPETSELYTRLLLPGFDEGRMPKGHAALANQQIQLIRQWITQGAKMPLGDHAHVGRNAVHELFFLLDESRIAAVRDDGTIDLWETKNAARERRWQLDSTHQPFHVRGAGLHDFGKPRASDPFSRYLIGLAGHVPQNESQDRYRLPVHYLSGEPLNSTASRTFWLSPARRNFQFSSNGEWYLANGFAGEVAYFNRADRPHGGVFLETDSIQRNVSIAALAPDDRTIAGIVFGSQATELCILPIEPLEDGNLNVVAPIASALVDGNPTDVAWNPAGDHVAIATGDGGVLYYAVTRPKPGGAITDIRFETQFSSLDESQRQLATAQRATRVGFSGDGKRLLLVGVNCDVFDLETNSRLSRFTGHDWPLSGRLSFNGQIAVTGDSNGNVHTWQTDDGLPVRQFLATREAISQVWWNRQGGGVQWSHSAGDPEKQLDLNTLAVAPGDLSIARPPDQPSGLAVDGQVLVHTWLGATVKKQTLNGISSNVSKYAFFERSRLAVAPRDSTIVHVYEINETANQLSPFRVLHGHSTSITDLAFSPDGDFLATSGGDGSIRLWNLRSAYDSNSKDVAPWVTVFATDRDPEIWMAEWKGDSRRSRPDALMSFASIGQEEAKLVASLTAHGTSASVSHTEYTNAVIRADLLSLDAEDAPFQRYFSFAHLYFGGFWQREPNICRNDLTFLLNSLSWAKASVEPVAVDPASTVFRIDLRQLRPSQQTDVSFKVWPNSKWDELAAESPYRQAPLAKDDPLRQRVQCDRPWIRGDWFVAEAIQPPRYIDLLDIPATESLLKKRIGVGDKRIRVGFANSGIMKHNRLLERRPIHGDGGLYPEDAHRFFWKSFDFLRSTHRRNLFNHPIGPDRLASSTEEPFEHDAAEVLFSLPNGFLAYAVFDAAGGRWEQPAKKVTTPQNSRYPHNCMGCHSSGVLAKADELGPYVQQQASHLSPSTVAEIARLHPSAAEVSKLFEADEQTTLDVLSAANVSGFLSGLLPGANEGKRSGSERSMSLAAAALETGQSIREFRDTAGAAYGQLRGRSHRIDRESFESTYQTFVGSADAKPAINKAIPATSNGGSGSVMKREPTRAWRLTAALALLAAGIVIGLVQRRLPSRLSGSALAASLLLIASGLGCSVWLFVDPDRFEPPPQSLNRKTATTSDANLPTPDNKTSTDGSSESVSQSSPSLADGLDRALTGNEDFNLILMDEPTTAVDFAVHAWVHNERRDPTLALEACQKALELEPTLAAAMRERGYALLLKGRLDDARQIAHQLHSEDVRSSEDGSDRSWSHHAAIAALITRTSTATIESLTGSGDSATALRQSLPDLPKLTVLADLSPDTWELGWAVYLKGASEQWKTSKTDLDTVVAYVRIAETLAPKLSKTAISNANKKASNFLFKVAGKDPAKDEYREALRLLTRHVAIERELLTESPSLRPALAFVDAVATLATARSRMAQSNEGDKRIEVEIVSHLKPLVASNIAIRTRLHDAIQTAGKNLERDGLTDAANEYFRCAGLFAIPDTPFRWSGTINPVENSLPDGLSPAFRWQAASDALGRPISIKFVDDNGNAAEWRSPLLPISLVETALGLEPNDETVSTAFGVLPDYWRKQPNIGADTVNQAHLVWLLGYQVNDLDSRATRRLPDGYLAIFRALASCAGSGGYSQIQIERGASGGGRRHVTYRYLDRDGRPVRCTRGYTELRRIFPISSLVDQATFFPVSREETRGGFDAELGFSKSRRKYDAQWRLSTTTFLDANDNKVNATSGYSTATLRYNNNVTQQPFDVEYSDRKGRKVDTQLLVATSSIDEIEPGDQVLSYGAKRVNNIIQLEYEITRGDRTAIESKGGDLRSSLFTRSLGPSNVDLVLRRGDKILVSPVNSDLLGLTLHDRASQ